jgi:succinyl-CoA synthetase alpha subunit
MTEASAPVTLVEVRGNAYVDSVTLLRVSSQLAGLAGVEAAAAVLGTELNRELLREAGLLVDAASGAGGSDLVVAVRARDRVAAEGALTEARRLLEQRGTSGEVTGTEQAPRSIASAVRRLPGANLALISVPGPFAAAEAAQALGQGLHVFLFSDNVAIEDEVRLKQRARAAGQLLMGPDCGTAIVDGIGLGFANVVRRGSVGLIGASGSGLQEVSCLLDAAGIGISQAIGTGSRDLSKNVGGSTTHQALDLLASDDATEAVVLISKPADPAVGDAVLAHAARIGKPVVACILGAALGQVGDVALAGTLAEAAELAIGIARAGALPERSARILASAQPCVGVHGLFCGGTLATEAALALGDPDAVVDFGDDRFTRGRAHPMIDPTLRNRAIVAAGDDASVRVLLLDVILGYGAHPDPATVIGPAVETARRRAENAGRALAVLGHVVGTERDPQVRSTQEARLRAAGMELYPSNLAAALAARGRSAASVA